MINNQFNTFREIAVHGRLTYMDSDNQTKVILYDLQNLAALLESHSYRVLALTKVLAGDNEPELWDFLTSNSLWGGAGSIADQALIESPEARREMEEILIRLGKAQERLGRVNMRTEMWVSAFETIRARNR